MTRKTPLRVLVVEDNPGDARLLELHLQDSPRWEFEVETAGTLGEAISRAETAPDVVLLDLSLPDGEGLELFRRASEAFDAPLVLVTGRADDELVEALAQAGAQDYLVKDRLGAEALQRAVVSARERYELLEALHERERELRTILDHTPDIVARFDREGRCVYVNGALERALGIPRGAVLGRAPREAGMTDPDEFLAAVREVFESAEPADLHRRIETSLGSRWFHTRLVPERDDEGRVRSVLATSRDETGRVRAQQQLETTAAALRERVKESECLYAVSRVLYDAETVEQALDEVAELLPPGFLFPEIAGARVRVEGASSQTEGFVESPWSLRQELVLAGEAIGFVEVSYAEECPEQGQGDGPFLLEERMLLGAVAERIEDAMRRERAREELSESQTRLRRSQSLEAMGQLAGGIAHDFNNLLTAISGYTELLLARADDEEVRADLEEIRDAAAKAGHLTGQLLAFGRRQILRREVLDLGATLQEIERMLRRVVGEGVRVALEEPRAPVWIEADIGQIQEALFGIAAFVRGGAPDVETLTLRLERVSAGESREALLVIEGDGSGLEAEERERLFEPFYTSREMGRGWGLGLASVQGIIAQSGGRISVGAAAGDGIRFELRFPAAEVGPVAAGERRPSSRPGLPSGRKILVIEDDRAVRDLVVRALRERGYDTVPAEDGREGLRIAASLRRDLALAVTDVVMPGLRGPDLARKLVGISGHVPILFMSGYADESLDAELAVGSRAFLHKPFTTSELLARVEHLLSSDTRRGEEVS